jgi:DNA-binding CsgD family transcriptional regulator
MTVTGDAVLTEREFSLPGAATHAPRRVRLSPRELQVLSHVALGHTSQQTSRRLGISRSTVETYLQRLRVKLETPTRAHLIRIAVHLGL